MKHPTTYAQAFKAKIKAKQARDLPDYSVSNCIVLEEMEKIADRKLSLETPILRGTGGELIPPAVRNHHGMELAVSQPSMISVEASIQRVDLADKVGVFEMALDTAETICAHNATEQMLAHQMAAAHRVSMNLLERSCKQTDTVEMARLATAAARLMDTYQKAMITLSKVRTGGKQVVTVQYVQVASGGQALVKSEVNTSSNGVGHA